MNIVYKDGKAYFAIECGKEFGVYLPSIHEVEK